MENNKPKEQIAFDYRGRISHPGTHRRVVKTPQEIVQPMRWADRQAHQRRAYREPRSKNRSVRRTLAHSGISANEGQVRFNRPLPRQNFAAQVPVRSSRQKARNWRFWRRFLTLFALLVIGILGVSFALSSTNFRVQQIDIMGTQNSKLVDSIQHMGIQGQNIFLLNVGDLTTRIEALPMVASANLSKQLPDLLIINVVERTPVLLWQTQQGTFSVDSKGVVIELASDTTGTDHLMTVVDTREGVAQVHPGALLNQADIAFATQVFERLPQMPGLSSFTLRYGVIPREGGIGSFIIVSSDGWLAYLGGADDNNPLDNRLVELQQILSMAQQKHFSLATIDLRFGLHPVFTLKA